jgi:hypothetical protein
MCITPLVMAGLDPAIQRFMQRLDGHLKGGHDGLNFTN